jgi:hypothetical protein
MALLQRRKQIFGNGRDSESEEMEHLEQFKNNDLPSGKLT